MSARIALSGVRRVIRWMLESTAILSHARESGHPVNTKNRVYIRTIRDYWIVRMRGR
jgi:hypothetical protein